MPLGLRIRFKSRDGSVSGDQRVERLPAGFGRNPMNDCPIGHPFVSEFHAVVEVVNGRPCLRDLNSRNGVFDQRMTRLAPGASVPLSDLGNTFVLGRAVEVTVEPMSSSERPDGHRLSSVSGSVLGNRSALYGSMDPPALPALSMGGGALPPLGGQPSWGPAAPMRGGAPAAYPPASPVFGNDSLPPLAPVGQRSMAPERPYSPGGAYPAAYPPTGGRPQEDARRPSSPPSAMPETQHLSMSAEAMALQGLRELAASLVPGAPFETTGDIARIVTKLHDLVEVLCRCLIPLRDSHLRAGGHLPTGRGAAAFVATVPDAARLASGLVNWRNRDFDAPDAVERVFVEIARYHAQLVDGAARHTEELLKEIAPTSIEQSVGEGGVAGMFGKHRALWHEYRIRYSELVNEDGSLKSSR
ncbi:MAG TPA: FHA domain-containing protein [Polyangiaceae bacterium]|jgi:type VI secretion system protein ImpI|nr:FHA domain-containing protein [Polyangiaceae bacterium]